ncbi:hypothetical protein NESM_000739600 [Novymonas esmeraldas]|uniref:Membrane-associated protein n=1 Tax=Novymonas esmeraldas TaxID=1808958 RepID=A0AAW0EUD5_9TRYP
MLRCRSIVALAALVAAGLAGSARAWDGSGGAMGDFSIYILLFLSIGGVACGAVIVLPVVCLSWHTLSLELQPRERSMWETAPSSELSSQDIAAMNKLQTDTTSSKRKNNRLRREEAQDTASAGSSRASSTGASVSPAHGAAVPSRHNSANANTSKGPGDAGDDDVVSFGSSRRRN